MLPYEALKKAVKKWGKKGMLISEARGEVTFEQMLSRTTSLASAFEKAGVTKGDVIAALLPNSVEWAEAFIAAGALGAIFQPLDVRFRGEELRNTLTHTGAKMLLAHVSSVAEIEPVLPPMGTKVLLGGERDGWSNYEKFLASGTAPRSKPKVVEEKDTAVYLFTSGSTGMIKCVPMTWRHLDFFPEDMRETFGLSDGDTTMTLLPMSHISGPILVNLGLAVGCRVVATSSYVPDSLAELVSKWRVTWAHTVPAIAELIVRAAALGKDFSSLKFLALMGTSIPVDILYKVEAAMPSCKCVQGYGLTETSPLLTLLPMEYRESKRGSIGRGMKHVEMRLVDDDWKDVPAGEAGELIVRGPKVFSGYYKNPELTQKVFREGWFHTNDVLRCDTDGFYFHLGRKDDVINTGGLKVYPAEVESALRRHEKIRDVLAFGIPDAARGKVVAAEVVPKERMTIDQNEIRTFLRSYLAEYKIPVRIEIVPEIKKTPTGKPIRPRGE
jgi:fatty-acyl-CoA synthase